MLSSTAYADLEVRILSRVAGAKPEYEVELTLDQARWRHGAADFDGLQPWDPTGPEAREEYARRIFERLFPEGELKTAWDSFAGENPLRRIRLRIDADLPQLHLVQWELLRLPGDAP